MYMAEAERLFVQEHFTITEIAARLRLNEKTLRSWKEEGDWDTKKKNFLASRQSFAEELYDFTRTLMKKIKEDLEAGNKIDTGRMYAFTQLCGKLTTIKKFEGQKEDEQQSSSRDDVSREEIFEMISKALHGDK